MTTKLNKKWSEYSDDDTDTVHITPVEKAKMVTQGVSFAEKLKEVNSVYHLKMKKQYTFKMKYTDFTTEELEDMENVSKTDEQDELSVYNYSSIKDINDDTREVRGLIFDKDKIVSRGFMYTPDIVSDSKEFKWDKYIEEDTENDWSDKNLFFKAYEGATVRLWFSDGKGILSTNRRLDAERSKWGSNKSFGQLFKEGLNHLMETDTHFQEYMKLNVETPSKNVYDDYIESLDKNLQYTFFIPNNKTSRIVCEPDPTITLLHIGTFNKDWNLTLGGYVGIPHPEQVFFSNLSEFNEYMKNVDETKTPGLIMFKQDGSQVKFVSDKYRNLFILRDNVPSIPYRYLQIRSDIKKSNKLRKLYPAYCDKFDEYEIYLNLIATEIHGYYCSRYIRKQYVNVAPELYNVMKECHAWHCENRKTNIVTRDMVFTFLGEEKPNKLNKMIKSKRVTCQKVRQIAPNGGYVNPPPFFRHHGFNQTSYPQFRHTDFPNL